MFARFERAKLLCFTGFTPSPRHLMGHSDVLVTERKERKEGNENKGEQN